MEARKLGYETLETRRLLVAEGDAFQFSGPFDAGGVVGSVSGLVRWGDGTSSPLTSISGPASSDRLRVRFDYSLDTGGFFADPLRRSLLQLAADSLVSRFGDTLAAITPGGNRQWEASVFHPSSGQAGQLTGTLTTLPANPSLAANEIVVYAGARDLPGAERGVGGPGNFRFPAVQVTCQVQAECDRQLAEIEAFRNVVRGRGQAGALASPQTDVAPQVGSVSFDNRTDWYFAVDADAIRPGQVDFLSAAVHELAHVLGFGITRTNAVSSWQRLVSGGFFTGASARQAYQGSGDPPIEGNHWARAVLDQAGQRTLMAGEIATGQRQLFTTLDFAAMKDLGWELLDTNVRVSATHRFADDGVFPVDLVLRGSRAGEVVHRVDQVTVTNVAPTLTVADQTATVGLPLRITNIGTLTDPGLANPSANPPTAETFSYTIQWGDGTANDEGVATIDVHGDGTGKLTEASFDATHTYTSPGAKTVTVRVRDDDGGTVEKSFRVDVAAPPALSLELDRTAIDEDGGEAAATLTIRRSGPATGSDQTITLTSSDPSEAVLPASVVIPGNATLARVSVRAVDDALLDGDVAVRLSAASPGLTPDDIELLVRDRESLRAAFSLDSIGEQTGQRTDLVLGRSNTDVAQPLAVSVSSSGAAQVDLPATIVIPAGQQQVTIALAPIDDGRPEPDRTLVFTFTAASYQSASAQIRLLDDEPPLFQNPQSRFDVNGNGEVTAADALRIINQVAIRGGAADLLPDVEQPGGIFLDVSGDYRVTSLDALLVINEVGRMSNARQAAAEIVILPAKTLPKAARKHGRGDDRDAGLDVDADGWQIEVEIARSTISGGAEAR
jgi:PKD repeat protein